VLADRGYGRPRLRMISARVEQLMRARVIEKPSCCAGTASTAPICTVDGPHEAVHRQVDDEIDETERGGEVFDGLPLQILRARRIEVRNHQRLSVEQPREALKVTSLRLRLREQCPPRGAAQRAASASMQACE
jgi:hypothetical protein